MNKKGASLGTLYSAILAIVLVGMVLGIGLYILVSVSQGISSDTITIVNESVTFENVTNGGESVATVGDCQARDFVITSVWNASDGVIPTSNYTFSSAGLLTASSDSLYTDVTANVSYTYTGTTRTSSSDACESISTTNTGLAGFADWIAIIVVIIAASIILGVVLNSFGRKSSV